MHHVEQRACKVSLRISSPGPGAERGGPGAERGGLGAERGGQVALDLTLSHTTGHSLGSHNDILLQIVLTFDL